MADVSVDLKLSTIKPLHARWFLKAFETIRNQESVMIQGWKRTGILETFGSCRKSGNIPQQNLFELLAVQE